MQTINPAHRIAINGMGRIGRTLFRVLAEKKSLHNLVAVNDIMPKENMIYLLKYDSIRGPFAAAIVSTANGFTIDGHEIFYSQESQLPKLPWKQYAIDTAVEATGLFTASNEAAQHLAAGASRVLLTTFSKDIPSTILGVSQHLVDVKTKIISPGDCTINCAAPLIDLIQKKFGVLSVHINVIQGYTTRQELLDGPYKGLRRGRAAAHSIVPFEVNIKPVLETIFPELKNRIESMTTRVPVPCGAMADISFVTNQPTTTEEVQMHLTAAANDTHKNILSTTYDPIVSVDVLGNAHSSTVDLTLTRVTNRNHLKLLAWFDNEWGYANRLFDWLQFATSLPSPS